MNIDGSCSKKQKRSGKVTDELLTEVNNFRTPNLEDIPQYATMIVVSVLSHTLKTFKIKSKVLKYPD